MTTTSLQAELKQSRPFPSAEAEAMLSILRTAAMLDHQIADALKPHGLTPTQHNVLRILRGAGADGLCGREIGERLVARVPDVPRLLERMESQGLIDRQRDPDDRRHVTARITRKGLDLVARVTPDLEAVQNRLLGHVKRNALRELIDGLATIRSRS